MSVKKLISDIIFANICFSSSLAGLFIYFGLLNYDQAISRADITLLITISIVLGLSMFWTTQNSFKIDELGGRKK